MPSYEVYAFGCRGLAEGSDVFCLMSTALIHFPRPNKKKMIDLADTFCCLHLPVILTRCLRRRKQK